MKGAVAIFVKTPDLSPLKTRLAKTIGKVRSLEFYHLSLDAVKENIRQAQSHDIELTPVFAVAEEAGLTHELWQGFTCLYTQEGGLGERMSHIYHALLKRHDFVLLIGSDSPQISPDIIVKAAKHFTESDDFIIGPAMDGGFYLFGGSRPVPENIWSETPYSQSDTLEIFLNKLNGLGEVSFLKKYSDVDEEKDLKIIIEEMPKDMTASQRKLKEWILK